MMQKELLGGLSVMLVTLAYAQAEPAQATAGGGGHRAAEGDWARRYARHSVGLTQGGAIVGVPQSSTLSVSGPQTRIYAGLGAAVRVTFNHFLVEPQLGFAVATVNVGGGSTTVGNVVAGVGIGGVVPLTDRLALSPMGRVAFDFPTGGPGWITILTGELPFTIFLGRNGYIEPYVMAGFEVQSGFGGPSTVPFVFGGGYRLGVIF